MSEPHESLPETKKNLLIYKCISIKMRWYKMLSDEI